MASAQVVVTGSTDATPALGGLFSGLSFFLLQRLPSRSSFVDKIQSNGGRVVKVETQADHVVADHYRHDCPPGSISYTFIDDAIKNGELPDPTDHSAGPPMGTVRPVASGLPTKGTRTPFTAEDDRFLWQWVEKTRKEGGAWKGNEIYKQLEAVNPRHTFQAWRDRYIKRLANNPPAGFNLTVAANAPPSPPTAQDEQIAIQPSAVRNVEEDEAEAEQVEEEGSKSDGDDNTNENEDREQEIVLPEDDVEFLLVFAADIEDIVPDQTEDAWEAFAVEYPKYSSREWKRLWRDQVRPVFLKQRAEELAAQDRHGSGDGEPIAVAMEEELRSEAVQKRKRDPGSLQESAGRKRQRSAEAAISTEWEEAAQGDNERGAVRATVPKATFTSDLASEAQAQFDEEVLGIPRAGAGVDPISNVPTSDLDRAAEQQLLHESWEAEERSQTVENARQVANPVQSTRMVHSAAIGAESAALGLSGRRALTTDNLLNQQAQHRVHLRRGSDLPPDDIDAGGETQDQYATYLQDLVRQSVHSRTSAGNEVQVHVDTTADEAALPSTAFAKDAAEVEGGPDANLPMSSQEEIEDALDSMINWPESPKRAQRQDRPQSGLKVSQFETQVHYPALSTQDQDEHDLSSQPTFTGEPSYPQLPLHDSQSSFDAESSYVLIDKSGVSQRDQPDEVVDLSIALPDGGWALSSSPAMIEKSQTSRTHANVGRHQQTAAIDPRTKQPHGAQQVEVISSAASSSSYEDSLADDEPTASQPPKALETQDILNAETQLPDLDMPLPPSSSPSSEADEADVPTDSLNAPSSSPPNAAALESQQHLNTTQALPDEDVDSYIETLVVVHGYKEAAIINALKCTSMRPELAEFVLLEEKVGRSFPKDVPGIWAKEDDEVLEGGDAKGLRELEKRHGWGECERRMGFLEDWREGDEGESEEESEGGDDGDE